MEMLDYKTKIIVRTDNNTLEHLTYKLNEKYKDKVSIEIEQKLTKRENEVLKLIVRGFNTNRIAEELIISKSTAKAHICSILHKLNVKNKVQAAVKAIKYGLV